MRRPWQRQRRRQLQRQQVSGWHTAARCSSRLGRASGSSMAAVLAAPPAPAPAVAPAALCRCRSGCCLLPKRQGCLLQQPPTVAGRHHRGVRWCRAGHLATCCLAAATSSCHCRNARLWCEHSARSAPLHCLVQEDERALCSGGVARCYHACVHHHRQCHARSALPHTATPPVL